MANALRNFIAATSIVDVHEHHIPEVYLQRGVNLLQLFQQSYAGWAQARPYPLPSETREGDPMLAGVPATTWEALQPFLEGKVGQTRLGWMEQSRWERTINDLLHYGVLDKRLTAAEVMTNALMEAVYQN